MTYSVAEQITRWVAEYYAAGAAQPCHRKTIADTDLARTWPQVRSGLIAAHAIFGATIVRVVDGSGAIVAETTLDRLR